MEDVTQQIDHIAACKQKSINRPRKTIKVCQGFYFLTVDNETWDISFDCDIKRWVAYVNRFIYADEKLTKREMIESLLA